MKVITTAELVEILRKHKMWLANEPGGERANLSEADLTRANLCNANLCNANLSGVVLTRANLSGVNLIEANLIEANLIEANISGACLARANLIGAYICSANLRTTNLYGANLIGANLSEADLSEADLYGANLSGADLSGADLSGAKNLNIPIACPEKGSFTAFKKVSGNYIVELEVPAAALRSSACSRKCRCSHAKVISFTNPDGSPADVDVVYSKYDSSFAYRVGEIVSVDNFDTNRWNECAPGIHFFITRQEAVDY